MKTIYVFEGVERIGKTTLIDYFREFNPGIVISSLGHMRDLVKTHNSMNSQSLFKPISNLNDKMLAKLYTICKEDSVSNIYIDRWFVSEVVYQKSYTKRSCDISFPTVNLVLYMLIGPDDLEFYENSNTKQLSKNAYFDNKLFKKVLDSYRFPLFSRSPYRCDDVTDQLPHKKDARLYKIYNSKYHKELVNTFTTETSI